MKTSEKKKVRFHIHMGRCLGCPGCVTACRDKNALPRIYDRRRVAEMKNLKDPSDESAFFLPTSCNHCSDPACLKSCPVAAYSITPEGIVLHDEAVCMDCGNCTDSCPYGVPVLREDTGVVSKCDMCIDRLHQGEDPACVEACPASALLVERKPLNDILRIYLVYSFTDP